MNIPESMSYREKEMLCESAFAAGGPYWHMCTDGNCQCIIFTCPEEMRTAVNILGVLAASMPDIRIYTFELMNNHLHIIFCGPKEKGEELFRMLKKRLRRYFAGQKRIVDLSGFECSFFPIENLQSLRNEIVYVNRNGYLVNPEHTPYTYPWGANSVFFNPVLALLPSDSYNSLSVREKRCLCHSNDVCVSCNLSVYEGMILPSSFCWVTEAESFFRDAHHYFHMLTRNYEAYGAIAGRIHDSIFLTDEEMYAAVSALCWKRYGVRQPSLLSGKEKVEVARLMHGEYNASNRQIRSILKIAAEFVNELFPRSAR